MMKIISEIKGIFKMAFKDARVDFIPYIKPVVQALLIVGICYTGSYLISALDIRNPMFFVNLGLTNNFILFITLIMIMIFYGIKVKDDEIKKLKKEVEEWS